MKNRRSVLELLALGGTAALTARADEQPKATFPSGGLQLIFAFRDTVISFNTANGLGTHLGTVEGAIVGNSVTNFQFIPTSQSTIQFDNRCLITDLDGDQIVFRVVGSGKFIIPPTGDPATTGPANAGSPPFDLGNLSGTGGPLIATFTAINATGKYAFIVGRKFPGKMVAMNAGHPTLTGPPPALAGVLGTVYGEVYSDVLTAG